jgi:uncharacterized membrane protein YphA (DoxX/SURF4 family)
VRRASLCRYLGTALPTDRRIASRSVRFAACIRRHEICDEPLVKDEGQTMQDAMRQFADPGGELWIGDVMAKLDLYEALARQLRADSIRCSTTAGSGHPTSSLSAADLMAVLLGGHLRYDWSEPRNPANDHVIFSKGHASPLNYALFRAAGAITDRELLTFRKFGSRLEGHPTPVVPWVDVATGSLGQGLPIAVGIALAGKRVNVAPLLMLSTGGPTAISTGMRHAAPATLARRRAIPARTPAGSSNIAELATRTCAPGDGPRGRDPGGTPSRGPAPSRWSCVRTAVATSAGGEVSMRHPSRDIIDRLRGLTSLFLRLALGLSFLSALADRFGLWGAFGRPNGSWGTFARFVMYTGKLNWFVPEGLIPALAIIATCAEGLLGLCLVFGWHTRIAALLSGILLTLFGVTMAAALGVKAPLDFSVFSAAGGALLLATCTEFPVSADQLRRGTNK